MGDVYVMQQSNFSLYDPITGTTSVRVSKGDILVLIETAHQSDRYGDMSGWRLTTFLTSCGKLVECGHSKNESFTDSGWKRTLKIMR